MTESFGQSVLPLILLLHRPQLQSNSPDPSTGGPHPSSSNLLACFSFPPNPRCCFFSRPSRRPAPWVLPPAWPPSSPAPPSRLRPLVRPSSPPLPPGARSPRPAGGSSRAARPLSGSAPAIRRHFPIRRSAPARRLGRPWGLDHWSGGPVEPARVGGD